MNRVTCGALVLVGLIVPPMARAAGDTETKVSLLGATFSRQTVTSSVGVEAAPAPARATGVWTQRKYISPCRHDREAVDVGPNCVVCPEPGLDNYMVYAREIRDGRPSSEWSFAGMACASPSDAEGSGGGADLAAEVELTFRGLEWPKSEVSLEPGGGRTLVNLATNAYTHDRGPVTQHVTALGLAVEVEAAASEWVWHWGDGRIDTTSDPGAPGAAGRIRHRYTTADRAVAVRVDTVYRGRFRLPGGAWQVIPDPVTVRGDAQELSVHEAVAQLVP